MDAAKSASLAKGKEIYANNCLACHGPNRNEGNLQGFFASKDDVLLEQLGTSENRARVLEDLLTFAVMRGALLKACKDKENLTMTINGSPKKPCANNPKDVLHWRSTKVGSGIQKQQPIGYAFKPLDGIWARESRRRGL